MKPSAHRLHGRIVPLDRQSKEVVRDGDGSQHQGYARAVLAGTFNPEPSVFLVYQIGVDGWFL